MDFIIENNILKDYKGHDTKVFIPEGIKEIADDCFFGNEDIEEVVKALKSDWLTQGPCVTAFENAVCEKVGSDYGVSCTNGTSALHLAIVAAGVKKGDYVIAPAMTFAASANCARFEGAEVLFADIDNKTTVTMSVDSCRALLEKARKEGKPVKAVVTVDMTGHLCNMEAFAKLKKEFGFVWIQDACHSIGGSWTSSDGKTYRVGEYKEVDMTACSFRPVKHITTGEGGMVVTHNEEYAKTMRLYRTHGIVRDEAAFINKDDALVALRYCSNLKDRLLSVTTFLPDTILSTSSNSTAPRIFLL